MGCYYREEKEGSTTLHKSRFLCLLPERMEKSGWGYWNISAATTKVPAIYTQEMKDGKSARERAELDVHILHAMHTKLDYYVCAENTR